MHHGHQRRATRFASSSASGTKCTSTGPQAPSSRSQWALGLRLTWHQARHGDAGHRWLRGLIADIVGGLTSRWA